jgi:hypothetical protein
MSPATGQRGFSAVLFVVMLVMVSGLLVYGASLTSGQSHALAQEVAAHSTTPWCQSLIHLCTVVLDGRDDWSDNGQTDCPRKE